MMASKEKKEKKVSKLTLSQLQGALLELLQLPEQLQSSRNMIRS